MTATWISDNAPSQRWPVYTRGNVGEVYPDVVSPLGWSMAGPRAEAGWRAAYKELGAFRDKDFDDGLCFVGVFNGYCYLNASLLRVFGVRAPGSSPDAIDTQLLGEASTQPYDERKGDKSLLLSAKTLRSVFGYLNNAGFPEPALEARRIASERLAARPPDDAPDQALLDYVASFGDVFENLFRLHLLATAGSQIAGGYLSYLCLRAGDPGLQLDLTTDLGEVESAAPGEALWELSRMARSSPAIEAAFGAGLEGLQDRLAAVELASDFNDAFGEFLDEHGHRGPNEWEIASPTWRSEPRIALAAVDRMRLASDDRGPHAQRGRARILREKAQAELLENLGWQDRRSYKKVRRATGLYAQAREATKNQIIRVVNAHREVLRELARRVEDIGGDPNFARVCMLTIDEFMQYRTDPAPFTHVIDERFHLYERLTALEPPFVVTGEPPTLVELEAAQEHDLGWVPEGTELQGAGGSPGVVEGRARVVLSPTDPGELGPGDILVAPITDPSWTPLFMPAGGVVVDVGAIQSHAVVVSRELCIPCVVSVRRATEIIPDGAWIRIDGSSGTVRILEHPTGQDEQGASDVVALDANLNLERSEAVALLGGKGANLAEMSTKLDLPVPPAFVITTAACRSYLDGEWPHGLEDRIDTGLEELGRRLDRSFGGGEHPLLVSIRSGAPVSMPGMMDTVLNVGINPSIRDALAAETGDPDFAARTWLRFCTMYCEIVLGMDRARLDQLAGDPTGEEATNHAAERILAAAEPFGGIPLEPADQVRKAVEAVFSSWLSDRAEAFRRHEGISADLATAVVIQAMVFGNLDEHSGTGVVFTRNPTTGDAELYGDYLPMAQGEDVVSGSHKVLGLVALDAHLPQVHEQLAEVCTRLERHYSDMCDIEFTVAAGDLYILQTRIGRRSAEAAARIAVEMAEDPTLGVTRADAVSRIDSSTLATLTAMRTVREGSQVLATGIAASPGVGVGILSCDPGEAARLGELGEPVVLVRTETSPADVHGMVVAQGLVTTLGGSVSHAAVVARSWGIPAITGAHEVHLTEGGIRIGDQYVADGTTLTVDGSTGSLFEGDQLAAASRELPELDTLRRWASELGLALGETGSSETPGSTSDSVVGREISLFSAVRTVQLKGMCSLDAAAHALRTTLDSVAAALTEAPEGLIVEGPRGLALQPSGRDWVVEQLQHERDGLDTELMDQLYERFIPLNDRFKTIVSTWQTSAQDHEAEQVVVADLEGLHGHFEPLVQESSRLVPRLSVYAERFAIALQAIADGDQSMVASPLKDSYHTVWFEFHEELIAASGRDRLSEEQAEADRTSG